MRPAFQPRRRCAIAAQMRPTGDCYALGRGRISSSYYVLHMALQGRPWNDCKGAEKAALRQQFDALVAQHRELSDHGIETILDRIGTGQKR